MGSKHFTWAAAGVSATIGVALAGVLAAPPAAAQGAPAVGDDHGNRCKTARTISSEVLDFGAQSPAEFHVATDTKGNAYLNDSRNPGIWVNLDILPGAPSCVVGSAVGTDEGPAQVYMTLLNSDGTAYEAVCDISATPFSAANLAAACGTGFNAVPGTPV